MMTKKKRKMIMIGIPVLVLILIVSILIFLYFTTDMFKSNQTLFFKYFGNNYENINEIVEMLKNEEYNSIFHSDKYKESAELKINYTENYGTTSENTDNEINKLKLTIDGETDKETGYQYKDIRLLKEDEKNTEIEFIKSDNTYGIKFSDLFNQFITVDNNNLKDLFEKIGYSEEILQSIPDKIEIPDIQKIRLSEEELEIIKEKYLNIIQEKISKDNFSKKQKQIVSINNESINTNVYTLTLTKEQLNNIYLDILEKLKEEEIILNKINTIQNLFSITTEEDSQTSNELKSAYTNEIEEIIEKIKRSNIGNEEVNIRVYENKGNTIKTEIQSPDYEINFERLKMNEQEYANIEFKEKDNEILKIELNKKENNLKIIIKDNMNQNQKIITIENNQNIQERRHDKDLNIKFEDDKNKLDINYIEKINLIDEIENNKIIDDNDSVKLNELESEQLSIILKKISEEINKKVERFTQEIKLDDIDKMLKNIGILNEKIEFGNIEISESEKNRFNSNFEILQGENIKSEDVLNVIDIIKENVIDLQVVSNNELKIEISRSGSNEKLVKSLEEFIKKDNSRNYNVKLEYDENGLVKFVILTIIEKNR